MAATETTGNPPETLSDHDVLMVTLDRLERKLDHIDESLHELTRFIDAHKPALARGLALMDPGAKVRSMLPSRKVKP